MASSPKSVRSKKQPNQLKTATKKPISFSGLFPTPPSNTKLSNFRYGYSLPYYTMSNNETEYLVSNPSGTPVKLQLTVINKDCQPLPQRMFSIEPHCTKSILISGIVSNYYGISFLGSDKPVVVNIFYYYKTLTILGATDWAEQYRRFPVIIRPTMSYYDFNYRGEGPRGNAISGSIFISNTYGSAFILGHLLLYNKCKVASDITFKIPRHCTQRFDIPSNASGLAAVAKCNDKASINILYFDSGSKAIIAAEQVGEKHRKS